MINKLLFLLTLVIGISAFTGCTDSGQDGHEHAAAGEYYTCPMHPQVRSDKPGACPVCNMTLIKVDGSASKTETGIMLTDQQRKHANIQTYKVVTGKIGDMSTLTGEVVLNQNATESITARVPGRIEKLMVWSIGEKVRKGQPLYQIYSEQLLAAQQEYLLALQQESINLGGLKHDLADSSRQKLLLWGMTKGQIYLNGNNVGRYFQSTAKGGAVGPQRRYLLPSSWIMASGNNDLLLFDEHGRLPEKCRLVQAENAFEGEPR